MALTIRSNAHRTFGFGHQLSVTLADKQVYTFKEACINYTLLVQLRAYVAAGLVQILDSDPTHGFSVSRPFTARNQMHIILGVDSGGVTLPNGATLHYLTLGGVQFILGSSNIDGANAGLQVAALKTALEASAAFLATGATVSMAAALASPAEVAAAITGTFSGTGTDNDTITVAGQVYRLKDTLAAENDVKIGATAADTRNNLVAAINGAAGGGTTYHADTEANARVSAAASSTADIVLTALIAGVVGNSIAISESGTGFSFAGGATALTGGVDTRALLVVDGDAVEDWADFVANSELTDVNGDALGSPALTISSFTASTDDIPDTDVFAHSSRTVSAGDVTAGFVAIDTGLTDLTNKFAYAVRTSSVNNTLVRHNGKVEVVGGRIVLIQNDGNIDFAAGNIIQLFAKGND